MFSTDGGLHVNGSLLVSRVSLDTTASLCQSHRRQFTQFVGFSCFFLLIF